MIWALIIGLIFVVVLWFAYTHIFHKEAFASPEEKASFLIAKGAGADSFHEFRERTGGYNTDFYRMKQLEARDELTVANLAKRL